MSPSDGASESTLARRLLTPTVGSVLALVGFGFTLFGADLFTGDGDVGRHVRLGREILAAGSIPRTDLLSHTMIGEPFVPFEWLSEVGFALADGAGGLTGVTLLTAGLFGASIAVAYRIARTVGAGPLCAGLATSLSLLLMDVHLLPRPHLFTILLSGVFLLLLEGHRQTGSRAALVALPFVTAVWSNLHGGFLVGFVLLGVYVLDAWRPGSESVEDRPRLVVITGICFLASLLNPAGVEVWTHSVSYFGLQFLVDQTNEYRSPDFHQLYGRLFLLVAVLGLGLLASGRTGAGFRDFLLFAGWLAAGLMASRNIPLFGMLAVPWYGVWATRAIRSAPAGFVARLADRDDRMRHVEEGLTGILPLVGVAILLSMVATRTSPERYRFDPAFFPVHAVAELERLPIEGQVFNEMPWGGYLLYVRDSIPVFIDGQTDFYGEELSKDYLRIRQLAPGGLDLLDEYDVSWVLAPPAVPLVRGLTLDPRWEPVYEDEVAIVFSRTGRS